MERSYPISKLTLAFGLSIGSRPSFVLGHDSEDSNHALPRPPYHGSSHHPSQTYPHSHKPIFHPHFHPEMSFYATHQPYPSFGSSSVSPCFSHNFQILTNFYGDYFKKGVICSSGGDQIFDVRDEVKQGHNFELRSDIVKSFTETDEPAAFDTRDRGGLCDKVPKVCELFNQRKQRSPRLLPSTSRGVWSSVRDNINNIFSHMTRRSFPPPSSFSSSNPSSSETKLPLFSILSSPTFHTSEPGLDYISQPAQQQHQGASVHLNDSHAAESCHGDGCAEGVIHSTRFSGYPTSDGHIHPTRGVSVCEESEGVAYPLVGVSAITGRPVRLLQHHPIITQPVFFTRCVTPRTQLLSGKCQQKFLPVAFLVDEPDRGNGRYPRDNYRSSSSEFDEIGTFAGVKISDNEDNFNGSKPFTASRKSRGNESLINANLNIMTTNPVSGKVGTLPKERSQYFMISSQNADELLMTSDTTDRKLEPDFEQHKGKFESTQKSQKYEARDTPTEPLLAILSSTPEHRNRKLEALLKSIRGDVGEDNFKPALNRPRNRRSFPPNPTFTEVRSPELKPSERLSFSFLDNVFSGSQHKPSYTAIPMGATEDSFLDLQRYNQDYILVESGCKVIIDLPAVRREGGDSSLNPIKV